LPLPLPLPSVVSQVPDHSHEHPDDFEEKRASPVVPILGDETVGETDVEHGCRLGRRPTCDPIEACLLLGNELASTLGDVERNGGRGSLKLVGEVTASSRQLFDDLVGENDELDGALVNIEFFMVERLHEPPLGKGRGKGKGKGRRRYFFNSGVPLNSIFLIPSRMSWATKPHFPS